jgi:hypothetical protein
MLGADVRLEVPWQDIISSVQASQFICRDALPSQRDWAIMLGSAVKDISQHAIVSLLSSDLSACGEKWALLDSSFDTARKGFFDFEHNARLVYHSVQETSRFLADGQFEAWWEKMLQFRLPSRTTHVQQLLEIQSLASATRPEILWERSSEALWLMDFFAHSRHILSIEYDKPQEFKAAGSKRPADSLHAPDTYRQLFEFVSAEIFNYETDSGVKEVLLIHEGTPQAKVLRNFSEWLAHDNLSRKNS